MKNINKFNSVRSLFAVLILLHVAVVSPALAMEESDPEDRRTSSFWSKFGKCKDRLEKQLKKAFKSNGVDQTGESSESVSTNSLVFQGPSSTLVSPQITVSELFSEISIDSEEFKGWKPVGQELGLIAGWAQSQHRQDKLIEISRSDYEVDLILVNERPIVLNEENREFFGKKDLRDFPFDGTWAGAKYVFYPHTVVDTDEISENDKPITFFLVKKISDKPQSLNFSKGNESLHLAHDWYHIAVTQLANKNTFEAISGLEKSAEKGNAQAYLLLSQIYLEGKLVKKDEVLGMNDLKLAADSGSPEAQYQMGLLSYYATPATEATRANAFEWFSRATAQWHLRGKFYLASSYELGKGTAVNTKESIRLFNQVALASADGSVLELRAHIRCNELNEDYGSLLNNQLKLLGFARGGMPKAMVGIAGLVFDKHMTLIFSEVESFLMQAAAAGDHEAKIIIKQTGLGSSI